MSVKKQKLKKNKLMMEHAIEHVVYIKESKDDLRKINKVRKCERVIFPFELLGSNWLKVTNCVQDVQERSSVSWTSIEKYNGSNNLDKVRVNK